MVHVEYQFTMREWREAHLTRTSRYSTIGWLIVFALAFALAAVVHHSEPQGLPATRTAHDSSPPSTLALICWVLVLGSCFFLVLRQIRGVKGHWRWTVTLDLDDHAVQISVGGGPTRWRWEEFAAFFETERLLVLRLKAAKAVVPIPKRVLSEAQIEQVRQLAAVLAVPRPGEFPLRPIDPPVKP